jgi:hypothetical protein
MRPQAGLQIFLDGEAWNRVELLDPHGNAMLDVDVTSRAENYGPTELFSESSEPPFEDFPLELFKELFPEGTYTVRGTTIDGVPMTGTATLTHDLLEAPRFSGRLPARRCPPIRSSCSGPRHDARRNRHHWLPGVRRSGGAVTAGPVPGGAQLSGHPFPPSRRRGKAADPVFRDLGSRWRRSRSPPP